MAGATMGAKPAGQGHQPAAERAARGMGFERVNCGGEAVEPAWGPILGVGLGESEQRSGPQVRGRQMAGIFSRRGGPARRAHAGKNVGGCRQRSRRRGCRGSSRARSAREASPRAGKINSGKDF